MFYNTNKTHSSTIADNGILLASQQDSRNCICYRMLNTIETYAQHGNFSRTAKEQVQLARTIADVQVHQTYVKPMKSQIEFTTYM